MVPARDEVARLPACLDALAGARDRLLEARPGTDVVVTVVLDGCTDGSAAVVHERTWVDVVEVDLAVVGAVRAAGVRRAGALAVGVPPEEVWVACTDADSRVPRGWLLHHLALATDGCELVVGAVVPDPVELELDRLLAWRARHRLHEGHAHVHGANLGFTLAAHDAVGGFAPLEHGEDVDLVERLRAAGATWHATAAAPVVTSGRRVGRAPDGFAAYLLALDPR